MSDVDGVGNENLRGEGKGENFLQRVETVVMVSEGPSVGSVSNVGSVGSKDLRRRDNGICFLAMVGTAGTGGKQDRDSMSEVEGAGDGLTASDSEESRMVELTSEDRGEMGSGSIGEGGTAISFSCSANVGIARGKEGRGGDAGVSGGGKDAGEVSTRTGKGGGALSEAEGTQAAWSGSKYGRGGKWENRKVGTAVQVTDLR
jgi:hypothetical protein